MHIDTVITGEAQTCNSQCQNARQLEIIPDHSELSLPKCLLDVF